MSTVNFTHNINIKQTTLTWFLGGHKRPHLERARQRPQYLHAAPLGGLLLLHLSVHHLLGGEVEALPLGGLDGGASDGLQGFDDLWSSY